MEGNESMSTDDTGATPPPSHTDLPSTTGSSPTGPRYRTGPSAPTIVWGAVLTLAALWTVAHVRWGAPWVLDVDGATLVVVAGAVMVLIAAGIGIHQRVRARR